MSKVSALTNGLSSARGRARATHSAHKIRLFNIVSSKMFSHTGWYIAGVEDGPAQLSDLSPSSTTTRGTVVALTTPADGVASNSVSSFGLSSSTCLGYRSAT